jgi:hypothetical protein
LFAEAGKTNDRQYAGYNQLKRGGMHYKIAAGVTSGPKGHPTGQRKIEGIEMREVDPEILRVASSLCAIVYSNNHADAADFDELAKAFEALSGNKVMQKLVNVETLRADITKASKLLFFKKVLSIGIKTSRSENPQMSFLQNSNPSTQMVVAGMSLVMAMGLEKGGEDLGLEAIEPPKILKGSEQSSHEERTAALVEHGEKYIDTIVRNIQKITPQIEAQVLEARRQGFGLMPIGAKLHTKMAMDQQAVDFLARLFGMGQTQFRLIHANDSLLIPPMLTAYELKMLLYVLETLGITQNREPDLQLCMGGRWSEGIVPYVGSTMLLATQAGGTFKPGAFASTHAQTGARIMAYDDGVKLSGLPGDLKKANGRTDILGRQAASDADLYQIMGTLASHMEFGGRFEKDMEWFIGHHRKNLRSHGLGEVVHSSAWIEQHAQKRDSSERHENMVNTLGLAWLKSHEAQQSGHSILGTPMGDTGLLVAQVMQRMQKERKMLSEQNRDEFEEALRY